MHKNTPSTSTHVKSGRYCIVHFDHCSDSTIKPLSEKAFHSITAACDIRKKLASDVHSLEDICSNVPTTLDYERHGVHDFCYKRFTNTAHAKAQLLKSQADEAVVMKSPRKVRKRCKSTVEANLLPQDKCLFCDKGNTVKQGKFTSLSRCETFDAAEKILDAATAKGDYPLLGKISGIDLVAREARYHEHCRRDYIRRADRTHHLPGAENSDAAEGTLYHGCAQQRQAYDAAFASICSVIQKHVIEEGSVLRMTTVREMYLQHMQMHSPEFYNPQHTTQKLKEKLSRHFGSALQFWQPNVKSELIYSSDVPSGAAVEAAFESATSESQLLKDAAMTLRRYILEACATSTDMPWPPSAQYLQSDAVSPPSTVTDFLSRVITGKPASEANQRASRIAVSVSEDVCAAATCGRWKQPKHLLLAMTVWHLTGNAQIITMLNRLGHCSSYTQVLQLENAMAVQTSNKDSVLPGNISVNSNKFAHCCFDNFDLLEETASGAGTTHTTHGIIIQELNSNVSVTDLAQESVPKSKQKVKVIVDAIPPFFCPKRVEPNLLNELPTYDDIVKSTEPFTLPASEQAWTVCRSHFNSECTVPEWSGWISATSGMPKPENQSVVGFLPPIMFPITEYSTVHQCIVMAMTASEKLHQKYTFITMDLAAAKIALDITWHDPERFANVIIQLGGFHIMCSYLGALGKMMCGSGFEDILMQAGVCAGGSIDKVMAGKHFNRAVRVHQLMLEATERLLLEAFLTQSNRYCQFPAELQTLAEAPSHISLEAVVHCADFAGFVTDYNNFREEVRSGKLGSTAKFWVTYMESMWHLMHFQRAIKENNFTLYLTSMCNMCSLLFAADHVNYARYLPQQCMQMRCLSVTHPGALDLLYDNGFSVSRSSVPACRNAIDVTIEQTINRSAKTAGGIIGFSRNASAYYRWCVTRHTRAQYVEATMDRIDLDTGSSDEHKSLQLSRMKGRETAVKKVLEAFHQFTNPFNISSSDNNALFCLSSGQAAPANVASDLLGYVDAGKQAADHFVESRLQHKTVNFQDPIKRQNRTTFKSMAVHKKLSTSQKKTVELKAERNLLGRLLFLSQANDLSLPKLFEYPLGPIPWAIATADGGMIKTSKAQLLHHLESLVQPSSSSSFPVVDAVNVLDGNALLQACSHLPETFEDLAKQVFCCLPKSRVTHFLTDSYKEVSIKQLERNCRGQSAKFYISGPKTKLPRDFKAFLQNSNNKRQLIKLFLVEWRKYTRYLQGRTVYFVDEEDCWMLTSDGHAVTCTLASDLCSDHEEADTRVILHCIHASRMSEQTTPIVVRSPDTDVLILLLSYASSVSQPLYLDTGFGNKRRMVDVKAIAKVLGPELCAVLPAYHAFTGCDYTSAFLRKGKVKPFQILQRHPHIIKAFKDLGGTASINAVQLPPLEQFVCAVYGRPLCSNVNEVRYKLFQARYDVNCNNNSISVPNGVDLCLIPPCRNSLEVHIMRSNYVAYMWRNAHVSYMQLPTPVGNGWLEASDGGIAIQWTQGDLLPQQLIDVLTDEAASCANSYSNEDCCSFQEVEEDYELDNIIDVVFEDDDDDNTE